MGNNIKKLRFYLFRKSTIHTFAIKYFWVVLVIMGTYFSYAYAAEKKRVAFRNLEGIYTEIQIAKMQALREKEELELRIKSQSDPEWIEMVLMNRLGVVPEGQVKVHFRK